MQLILPFPQHCSIMWKVLRFRPNPAWNNHENRVKTPLKISAWRGGAGGGLSSTFVNLPRCKARIPPRCQTAPNHCSIHHISSTAEVYRHFKEINSYKMVAIRWKCFLGQVQIMTQGVRMRFEYLGSLHPSSSIYFNFISRTISVHETVSCGRQTAWGTFTECEGGKNLVLEES